MRSKPLRTLLETTVQASLGHQKQRFNTSLSILAQQSEEFEELVIKLCKKSRPHEALAAIASLNLSIITLSRDPLYHLLQSCLESKDFSAAQKVHCLIISNGLESTTVLLDHLIRIFASSGNLSASYQVFLKVPVASVHTWNAIISVHTHLKKYKNALALFDLMQQTVELLPDKITHLYALQACINLKDIDSGRDLHAKSVSSGLDSDIAIGSSIMHMYAQCGNLQDMQHVFDMFPNHDVMSWGVIISAYSQYGHDRVVVNSFEALLKEGAQPDRGLYVLFLKSCGVLGDLQHGRIVHEHIMRGCLEGDIFLQSAVIDMYSACRSLQEAYDVFNKMMSKDLVAWGAMLSACIHNGHSFSALILFENMRQEGLQPDAVIFLLVIKACTSLGKLVLGRIIHEQVVRHNLDMHVVISNTLLDLYGKCGSLDEASTIFEKLSTRDLVSWNTMLAAYADSGLVNNVFEMFDSMSINGFSPNNVSFICMLRTCGMMPSAKLGRLIHDAIMRSQFESDVAIQNGLVGMYARCQSLTDATKVFRSFKNQDVVTWSALISGLAQHGNELDVLNLSAEMLQMGIVLDEVVFTSTLQACGSLQALREGWLLNDKIIRNGLESHTVVGNSLVCMYAKCGSLKESHKLFRSLPSKDVVSWGALIGGYAQHGQGYPALKLFKAMLEEGIYPDQATFVCALKACSGISVAKEGRLLHNMIFCSEFASDQVVGNALLDMYLRCGSLSHAQKMFDVLMSRDIISWTTMAMGYTQHGHAYATLELYKKLRQEGFQPTKVLYLCVLQACVRLGAIEPGNFVYEEARKKGLLPDMAMGNSLVELHAKWGDLEGAEQVLRSLPCRDMVTWNVLMAGYAACGNYRQVASCLHAMLEEGLRPDDMMFTVILSACSNAGLLEESFIFFKSMVDKYRIKPDLEHYSCMIDVLGRAGRLEKAIELVHGLPNPPDDIVWQSLLANSRTYGIADSGILFTNELQEVEQPITSSWDGVEGLNVMVDEYDVRGSESGKLIDNRERIGFASMFDVVKPQEDSCFDAAERGKYHRLPDMHVDPDQIASCYGLKQGKNLAILGSDRTSNCSLQSHPNSKREINSSGELLDMDQDCNANIYFQHFQSTNLSFASPFCVRSLASLSPPPTHP